MFSLEDYSRPTRGDLLADTLAFGQYSAALWQAIGFQGRFLRRMDRLRSRLQDVQLAAFAVPGPFYVHGHGVAGLL